MTNEPDSSHKSVSLRKVALKSALQGGCLAIGLIVLLYALMCVTVSKDVVPTQWNDDTAEILLMLGYVVAASSFMGAWTAIEKEKRRRSEQIKQQKETNEKSR